MATCDENNPLNGFRGKIGNQLVLRRRNGKTIMASMPKRRKSGPKGKRLASCNSFKLGIQWAKAILKSPDLYEAYKTRAAAGRSALNVALADYMRPPKVTGINASSYQGRAGDIILVTATDDFHVKEVFLKICSPDGKILEKGSCQPDLTGNYWQYTTQKAAKNYSGITITAIARDNPGHTGEMQVLWNTPAI